MRSIGSIIAENRKKKGLSQPELAELLSQQGINITAKAISKWETGKIRKKEIFMDIRIEQNLIQEDLAEATGSCSRTIGRIERGERNPSLEMAIRLAHYLNMSVEEIFKLDDGSSSQQKAEE